MLAGARFTLDAMPGKQMAIDADLNAGLINEDQARERRTKVESEADLVPWTVHPNLFEVTRLPVFDYGDQHHWWIHHWHDPVRFAGIRSGTSILTVGDGLVSQIPALVISTAAGIIVSRACGKADQVSVGWSAWHESSVVHRCWHFTGFCLPPGMPFFTFALIASVMIIAGRRTMILGETASDG